MPIRTSRLRLTSFPIVDKQEILATGKFGIYFARQHRHRALPFFRHLNFPPNEFGHPGAWKVLSSLQVRVVARWLHRIDANAIISSVHLARNLAAPWLIRMPSFGIRRVDGSCAKSISPAEISRVIHVASHLTHVHSWFSICLELYSSQSSLMRDETNTVTRTPSMPLAIHTVSLASELLKYPLFTDDF